MSRQQVARRSIAVAVPAVEQLVLGVPWTPAELAGRRPLQVVGAERVERSPEPGPVAMRLRRAA